MIRTEQFHPEGEVSADDRARIAFGRLGVSGSDRFAVSVSEHGEILLTPVASIPKRELLVWEDEKLRASLARGLEESALGKVAERGSFAKYADADD